LAVAALAVATMKEIIPAKTAPVILFGMNLSAAARIAAMIFWSDIVTLTPAVLVVAARANVAR